MTSETSAEPTHTDQPVRVAFCGGGSGGHLTPALAIAEELCQRDHQTQLQFFVSARPVDQRVLTAGTPPVSQEQIFVQPLMRSSPGVRFAARLTQSFFLCRRRFQQQRPDVVVGTGGFASLPGVLAAWWRGIPVVLLELNRIPGRATRTLARFCQVLLTGWPLAEAVTQLLPCPIRQVGVPVSPSFFEAISHEGGTTQTRPSVMRVLVVGGSQGARRLNELVQKMLLHWDAEVFLDVLHQTGVDDSHSRPAPTAPTLPDRVSLTTVTFLTDMCVQLASADLVICRCGAVTLAELAAAATPAILVPLPTAADEHQRYNAEYLVQRHAAVLVDERAPDAATLLRAAVQKLLTSDTARDELSDNLGRLAQPLAARQAADAILNVAQSEKGSRG
ncbi:MAG: glycosyltransferase [Planctomycetaceae bacterium]|nr:glycosyltransferase [Planctomycetaceae bacterium]